MRHKVLRVWRLIPLTGAPSGCLDDPGGDPDVCLQPDDYDENINLLPETNARDTS